MREFFGRTRSSLCSTECQGCGDLHGHTMVWTVLTPEVLQSVAGKARLAQKKAELIDTMITSCRNLEHNSTGVICTTMNQRPLCAIWQHQPDPETNDNEFTNSLQLL